MYCNVKLELGQKPVYYPRYHLVIRQQPLRHEVPALGYGEYLLYRAFILDDWELARSLLEWLPIPTIVVMSCYFLVADLPAEILEIIAGRFADAGVFWSMKALDRFISHQVTWCAMQGRPADQVRILPPFDATLYVNKKTYLANPGFKFETQIDLGEDVQHGLDEIERLTALESDTSLVLYLQTGSF